MRSILAALALTVFASGCVAPETTGGSGAPTEGASSSGSFALSTDGDYDVAGTWEYADVVVQFESHISEEGVATVKLTVDGADFDTTFDYFTQAWEADGHKNTLFRPELDALLKLENYLDNNGKQGRPWERLFTAVSQHGAAPPGYTFLKRTGSPTQKDEVQHRESNAVWNDGVTYLCSGGNGRNYSNSWDYNWATHDSLSGEGGSPRNASAGNTYHGAMYTYDAGGCYVGSSAHSGNSGHGSCEGRCGAGCPRTYNFYFTQDCFDHDVCLDYHPAASAISYSGDCGYEFGDADGDFAGGTSSGYYWGCPGSVPSSCPDNGNATYSGT